MSDIDDDAVRRRILDAALAELSVLRGVDGFTLERVAARAGVDAHAVRQLWPNTPEIFTAALLDWGKRHIPIPDTGTLRGGTCRSTRGPTPRRSTPDWAGSCCTP